MFRIYKQIKELIDESRFQEASEICNQILIANKNSYNAHYFKYIALKGLVPNSNLAYYHRKKAKELANSFQQLKKEYKQLAKNDNENKLSICNKLLEIDEISLEFYNKKAVYLYNLGRYDESINIIKTITLDREPENKKILYNLSLALTIAGNYSEAIKYVDRILEINSSQFEKNAKKALCYYYFDDHEASSKHYNKLIEFNSGYLQALFHKATLLNLLGRSNEALEAYNKSMMLVNQNSQLKPQLAISFKKAGEIYQIKGDYWQAVNCYDEASKLGMVENEEIFSNKSIAMRTIAEYMEESSGEYATGECYKLVHDLCTHGLAINPNSLVFNFNLAISLEKLGRSEEAKTYFRVAENHKYCHGNYVPLKSEVEYIENVLKSKFGDNNESQKDSNESYQTADNDGVNNPDPEILNSLAENDNAAAMGNSQEATVGEDIEM
jgi:tetratricopeptide (TPR) repeat protein